MVAVRIPVAVGILLRGDVVDDKISGVIPVQTSDDVQKCGFTGTGRPQDSNKLIVPEIQGHTVQSFLMQLTGNIFFSNILNLKHLAPLLVYNQSILPCFDIKFSLLFLKYMI